MRSFLLSSILLTISISAQAVSFKNVTDGVWSTGLSNTATVLTAPAADSHYILIPPAGCGVTPTPANCSGFGSNAVIVVGPPTSGTWPSGNGTESAWVGPIEQQGNVGNNGIFNSSTDFFVYRLIFNLSNLGLVPDNAQISLRWLSDNNTNSSGIGTENSHIRLCSIPDPSDRNVCSAATAVPGSQSGSQSVAPFDSQPLVNLGPSLFSAGYMAMDFIVYNAPVAFGENPSGLRVEIVSATADPAPEPLTLSMFALGFAGLGLLARHRK